MENSHSLANEPGDATVPSAGSRASRAGLRDLYEAVMAISTELDLSNVLRHIVNSAKRLAGADYAAFGVLDETGTELREFVYDGIDPELGDAIGRLPEGRGILDEQTRHPNSRANRSHHHLSRALLEIPITIDRRPFGNLYLTKKANEIPFSDEDETVVMMLANAASTAIQNARLYERSLRHRRWLEATTEIITHLLRGARSEDVLTQIAQVAHQMAGADECGVRLADPTNRHLRLTAAAGTHSMKAINEEMLIHGTFLGAVFATGTSSSTSDLEAIAPNDTLVLSRGVGPVLAVALITPERTLGTLSLSRYKGRAPFDPGDLELVESFAGQAALALAFDEARELHERATLNDDRERIARDLHDLVIQRIFASGLTLQSTASMLEQGPIQDRVNNVVSQLDDTIAELRTTIFALQQNNSRTSTLRLQITELVRQAGQQLGFAPRLRISGEIGTRVNSEITDHLLAVLRETISNVARHAAASQLHITIEVGAELRLQVDDDGNGLPDHLGRRSGLKNLEERASGLGGTVLLDRSPLGGARVVWCVPLARSRDAATAPANQ